MIALHLIVLPLTSNCVVICVVLIVLLFASHHVVTSYNSINGVPSCANEQMLGKILRGKWGFQGMVTSDSGAVADISSAHHYTPDLASATVAAVSAGCDVESAGWGNDPAKGIGPWATGKAP